MGTEIPEPPEGCKTFARHLSETFENPEVKYVTFERGVSEWLMRRFTRIPENSSSPLHPLLGKPLGWGIFIGRRDRSGSPIHIGDTLHFDASEWGGDGLDFTIKLEAGEICHPGAASDLSEWCTIVRRFDEP